MNLRTKLKVSMLVLATLAFSGGFVGNGAWAMAQGPTVNMNKATTFTMEGYESVRASEGGSGMSLRLANGKEYRFRWYRDEGRGISVLFAPQPDGSGAPLVLGDKGHMKHDRYDVFTVQTHNPDMKFWVIGEYKGAKLVNHGFWILGDYKGQLRPYMGYDELMSLMPDHQPREYVSVGSTPRGDGLRFIAENGPTWHKPTKQIVFTLFWDKKAQWFGVRYGS